MSSPTFQRYVALGDSISEGIGDSWPDGTPRGWCDRLAAALDAARPGLRYANLAVRGQTSDQVLATQVADALALKPDLISVSAGMNDLMRPGFSLGHTRATLDALLQQLRTDGATVVILSLPDMTDLLPIGAKIKPRVDALNAAIAESAAAHGAIATPPPPRPLFTDPRLWASDRLHLSGAGYDRVARAVLGELGVPAEPWDAPLPDLPPTPGALTRAAQSATWWVAAAGPWIGRRLTGRSSADGRVGKRLQLIPVSEGNTPA